MEECQVQRVLSEKGVVVGAETELGNIACEYFILAGGMVSAYLPQLEDFFGGVKLIVQYVGTDITNHLELDLIG